MYRQQYGTKKSGSCGEVAITEMAVSEGSTVVTIAISNCGLQVC